MQKNCEELIANEFYLCVENTIKRLAVEDTYRPFHSALLSEQALFWSRFERSFSTSFGQRVIEKISQAAAIAGGADNATTQKTTIVSLTHSQLDAIEDHITGLRTGSIKAEWHSDIEKFLALRSDGEQCHVRVISDLYWEKDGNKNYMSIKTVKPNIDQTAEAKRDLLKLKIANPAVNVYYGLYYNPYGESKLDYDWNPPRKIFNFNTDPCVLIGKDYWDTLGGNGFYEDVLSIAARVGEITRQKIQGLR